jgi:ABC-type bacteriocin/lantibiotic exporter with double-glycine peptidase domain
MTPSKFLIISLGLIFITLKLCSIIIWSWWLVLSPFLFMAAMDLLWVIFFCLDEWANKPRTPAEKLSRSLNQMADAIGKRKQ